MSDNPFWDFSLTHYAKAPVQRLCLRLQEQAGANVNIVLFTLWLASLERIFENDAVAGNTDLLNWHDGVIMPLRQARCAVKHCQAEQSALYEAVKEAELDAERFEQDMLCELLPLFNGVGSGTSVFDLAEKNLQAYLQTLPLAIGSADSYTKRLIDVVFQGNN